MSSGSYKRHDGFNPVQIKNGLIVRLGKDGRIREVIDPFKKGKDVRIQSKAGLKSN